MGLALCGRHGTGWSCRTRLEQIPQTVHPTADQEAALDDLRAASLQASDIIKSACPVSAPPDPDRSSKMLPSSEWMRRSRPQGLSAARLRGSMAR